MIQHSHLKTYIDTRLDSLSTTEREFLHNLQMLMTGTVKWEMIMAAFIKENQDLAVRLQELRSTSQVNERKNIGDNMENLNDFGYGTPRLKNKYDFHGTHVSGIIAADNKYSDGAVGIAPDAKIMGIKAIPAGDEYDKDVALAIRYAVDNGAHIINMSFGKSHSSHAKWVSKALKYAARHNVLVVVAAGNDGLCCNDHLSYPSPYCHHGKLHKNMLMIGNSTVSGHPAGDSNYGNKYVDFFAPGTLIYSCYPGNLYKKLSGTSMAAPVVSGVAALILSYFPGIKVEELKNILVESAIIPFVSQKQYRFRENRMVLSPEDLCRAGAILDASVAVEKAIQLSKK